MNVNHTLLFVLLLFCGCNTNVVPEKKGNVIAFEQMQRVLKDIHLADAIAGREGEQDNSTEARTKEYYKAVFEKHKISEEDFYKSLKHYMYDCNQLDSMYTNIINEISAEQAVVQAQ